MVPEIVHVPYGDIDALKQTVSANTAAILLEPIQHEAGIFLPRKSYLRAVRQLCDDKDVILILDEIKTGFGKTGYMFACEYFGIVPDILVVGKSLGGGLIPIGGLIAKKRFWKKFGLSFPMAASSFAGNTLACRTALTTIQIIQEEELLNDCRRKGALLLQKLNEIVKRYPSIFKTVNGLGLLIGINAVSPQTALLLAKKMIRQRVLMVPAFGNPSVLMIEPPLVISFKQIEEIVRRFESACGRSDRNS